jgi:tetratricopeptide (TPR) repeat protein
VLVLDTCEVLTQDLDRWLRHLLAPLCDGKTPLLILIASHLEPDSAESRSSREGLQVEVGDERWRSEDFNKRGFRVDEITLALQKLHRPIPAIDIDELAEKLHRWTLGVPFALRTLLKMHESGDAILMQLETLGLQVDSASQYAEEKVVEQVTARFLWHLQNHGEREKDLDTVVALALLREGNRSHLNLLKCLWGADNVREQLQVLATQYGLVERDDLHVMVRDFLRRCWRENRPEFVNQMIRCLTKVVETSNRPATPEKPEYFEALADRLNMQGWNRAGEALPDFAPALTLALTYDKPLQPFLTLAAELPPHRGQEAASQLLEKLSKRSTWGDVPWGSDELLAWLQNEAQRAHWTPIEQASLHLLIGLKNSRDQRYQDALTKLQAALKYFDAGSLPRPSLVGSALFVIGYALGEEVDTAEAAAEAYHAASSIGYLQAPAWNNLAVLASRRQKLQDAEECLQKALRLDEKEALYSYNLGHLYRVQKRYEAAEAQFCQSIDFDPDEPLYPCTLGHMFRVQKCYEAAEEYYRKALAVDEKYAPAYNGLGLLCWNQHRYEAAEAQFRQAIDFDPTDPYYYSSLGDMFCEQKRYEAAEEYYRKVLAMDEKDTFAYNDLGLLYWARKRYEVAEAQFRQALAIAPTATLYPYLQRQQKHYEVAEGWYRQALEVNTQHAVAYNDLGWLYQEQKSYKKAEEWYHKALAVDARYAETYNRLGLLAKARGQWEEAAAQFQRAIELEPTEPIYPRNVGDLYRERRAYEQAEEWYHKALAVDADYPWAYNSLGLLAKARGQWEEAAAQFKKALELLLTEVLPPHNPEDIYEELQRFEETEAWYCCDADDLCNIAWLLYLMSTDLIKAKRFATRSVEIGPGDNHTRHLLGCLRLAAIQLRRHGWDYASSSILEWLRRSDREFIRESRDDSLELFRVVLSLGRASELAVMLKQLEDGTHWLPWAEAIASLAGNDSTQPLSEEALAIRDELI